MTVPTDAAERGASWRPPTSSEAVITQLADSTHPHEEDRT